jgi:NADH-quinone oxidoreductase subunit N
MAAVTMSLGNVLALLQDNIKRLLAYSSVAHAGYMLIGLAAAPKLLPVSGTIGGVEALWFYLVAYGGMTVGAFAVLHYLSTKTRPVEKVDDLAGLSRSHPLTALVMVLFVLSLIGIPLTAGFAGKFFLFGGAMSVPRERLFTILALIGMLNAAVGGWYYLRIAVVMYLRETAERRPKVQPRPVLAAILVCAAVTLALGVYPPLLLNVTEAAAPRTSATPAGSVADVSREP